jgi:putative salt-induced outer membrane protein YdiY
VSVAGNACDTDYVNLRARNILHHLSQIRAKFRYKLFNFIIFSDRLLFYPSLGEGGEFTFRNEAALTAPLSARWAQRLANIVDYDSNPPKGIKQTDVQWILSLQYSF